MKERLKQHFDMMDMGSAEFLLGEVEMRRRLRGGYFLVQQNVHASEVVNKFGIAKVVSTPFEPGRNFRMEEVQEQKGVDPGMVVLSV